MIQDCELEDEFAFSMSTMQQVFAWKDEEQALKKIVHDIREVSGEEDSAKVEIKVVRKKQVSAGHSDWGCGLCTARRTIFFPKKITASRNSSGTSGTASVYYSEALRMF